MAINVLTWNVNDGFGKEERAERLVAAVVRYSPDVAFFSEACDPDDEQFGTIVLSKERLMDLGYNVIRVANADNDTRTDTHESMAINRLGTVEPIRLETRNAVMMEAVDPVTDFPVKMIGAHLDDRAGSNRGKQINRALELLEGAEHRVVLGDLNSLHRSDTRVRLMRRVLQPVATLLPKGEVKRGDTLRNSAHIGNIAARLVSMAEGEVLQKLEDAEMHTDPWHKPTFPAKRPVLGLDHIYASKNICLVDYEVHPTKLSDHLPVTAKLVP